MITSDSRDAQNPAENLSRPSHRRWTGLPVGASPPPKFIHELSPVAGGPSGKRCPWWPSRVRDVLSGAARGLGVGGARGGGLILRNVAHQAGA